MFFKTKQSAFTRR